MEPGNLIVHALTVAGSGGAGWLSAWLKHRRLTHQERRSEKLLKQRIDELEADLEEKAESLKTHIQQYAANNAGWTLELAGIKDDIEQERHLKDAIDKERSSRPDPLEDFRREFAELKRTVERLRERSGQYTKNEAFTGFVKAQEEQWREMNRHLGRLEGMLK